jgi:inner membrane protein involved in colicin E2 resistance
MAKRIAALVFIFLCTTAAWTILGATITFRTQNSDSNLRGDVASIWGTSQEQTPPKACYPVPFSRTEESEVDGRKIVKTVKGFSPYCLPLESSRIRVAIVLEPRQKGLLWYRTYKVGFAGDYIYRNTSDHDQQVTFSLPLPAEKAVYDDLHLAVDGVPLAVTPGAGAAAGTALVAAGKTAELKTSYQSQGLDRWGYNFGEGVAQVRDFQLKMTTNFRAIDFPENTLSPSQKRQTADGWELTWAYNNLLSGFEVGMELPEKLQPGPLAGEISYFAPVSLFFFFFLMFIITAVRGIDLHPMNYFFLAAAFFSFHLLMAYLVDHISIHAAFVISSVVSVFLVISYLRLVVGLRFAAVEAGISQLVYLVLFSYAFFFKGYTGLGVTIGSVLTLFVVMQMTGRIRWAEKFATQLSPHSPLS